MSYRFVDSFRAGAYVMYLRNSVPIATLDGTSMQSVILVSDFKDFFLGAFAKLRIATISFGMSVRPSAWNNSGPTGWIFMKFCIYIFFENLPRKSPLHGFSWNFIFVYFSKICTENSHYMDFHEILYLYFLENLPTKFPLYGFSWNFVFVYFSKSCPENSHWMDFHEILYLYIFRKSAQKIATVWIFMKFFICIFFENLPRKFPLDEFSWNFVFIYFFENLPRKFPLDGFSWNFVFIYFSKICPENSYWMDFHEILYLYILQKSAQKIPTEWIFMKFCIYIFFENLPRNFKLY